MNNQLELSFVDNETKIENNKEEFVSAAKAMKMLDLSRHNFEKAVQEGLLSVILEDRKSTRLNSSHL